MMILIEALNSLVEIIKDVAIAKNTMITELMQTLEQWGGRSKVHISAAHMDQIRDLIDPIKRVPFSAARSATLDMLIKNRCHPQSPFLSLSHRSRCCDRRCCRNYNRCYKHCTLDSALSSTLVSAQSSALTYIVLATWR